ncbi:hypothetical protein F0L74_24315 [Chitinophaga agrisoli]|uniref:Polyketide cyclase/dehydrase/lipid transport protein n=1 Tax=Chitinophaga agrisoli TaxID=2607653 RepID=A0A5B2VIC4_9BACT|nr:hypothetical protein [Chitinophaga agrisoli]KAA2239333.1 hypothetical protein F0L74_24315 [Chitinophaga agrisoli]
MNKEKISRIIKIVGIPLLVALLCRILFGIEALGALVSVMSIAFLFGVPYAMGALTIHFSGMKKVEDKWYCIFAPWVPVLVFFVITLLISLEGWACWVMALPIFLAISSLGGMITGRTKRKKHQGENSYILLVTLLPLLLSPIERMIGNIPGTYKAYTYIDIQAPAKTIWDHVTRVKEINAAQDKGWLTAFLGFPRPVKAELNYEGVGAYREAIFTKGLVFHEQVLSYKDQQKMVFSIKANPQEIPSTTMDKHVVIGGDYFDVLNGTYELQALPGGNGYRLHLYSHFKLSTTFNFYASWWARWIMQDIQSNILQVVKQRAEARP